MYTPAAQLDEEEHVQPLQPDRFHREEVDGEQSLSMHQDELAPITWLTLRRTYSSWAHDKGVPAKVIAQMMGHAKVDTTMNVYTQVLDGAARWRRARSDQNCSELFGIRRGRRGAFH